MNFARTNLSLLLARQNRQHAALGRTGPVGADRCIAMRLPAASVASAPKAVAPMAAATPRSQTLELVGAIAMMAAFMVLALFG